VTLGSPLTHAEFLLSRSKDDLAKRQVDREFPTCPPFRELLTDDDIPKAIEAGVELPAQSPRLMSFPFGSASGWQLHHAAPFSVVRWTNIYDPASLVYRGDIVSGPVRDVFGQGIEDSDLQAVRGAI
jgi:hypothetical protein